MNDNINDNKKTNTDNKNNKNNDSFIKSTKINTNKKSKKDTYKNR